MGTESKVDITGLQFHVRQSDKDAEEKSRESNLNAAAKAIVINFKNHTGSGDNAYITTSRGKKLDIDDIADWIDSMDTNKDGKVTVKELNDAGGDIDNILKINSSGEEQKKLSKAIYNEQVIGGIKGLGKGLDTNFLTWPIAKKYVIQYNSKDSLNMMFSIPEVREYYNKELYGETKSNQNEKSRMREHMKEIFQHFGYTKTELQHLHFSDEQIKYFLS